MKLSIKTYCLFVIVLLVCFCRPLNAQNKSINYTETNLNFVHNGDSIFGKLIIPNQKNTAKLPVVVFVHGSGPEDYSSSENYNYLFEEFARIGFASYSWDKPGTGKSQGQWYDQPMSKRATEVIAAINKLKTVESVDGNKIGLWGISQAGWVMPLVAGKIKLSFVISVSSPVTTAFDQELYRVKSELAGESYSTADIDKAIDYTREFKKIISEGKPYSDFLELQNQIDKEKWSQIVIRGEEIIYQYLKVILREDQVPHIENYRCPLLAVWGANDLLVPPIESSEAFGKKMKEIGNSAAVIKVIAQADHTLTYNLTGNVDDTRKRREVYKDNPSMVFAPGAIPLMTDWLSGLYRKQ